MYAHPRARAAETNRYPQIVEHALLPRKTCPRVRHFTVLILPKEILDSSCHKARTLGFCFLSTSHKNLA